MPIRVLLPTLLLLLTPLVRAVDLSGKWTGTLEFKAEHGHVQSVPAYAELKQQGDSLSEAPEGSRSAVCHRTGEDTGRRNLVRV